MKIERINTLLSEMSITVLYEKSVKLIRLLDRVVNEMMVVNSPKNSSSSTNFKLSGEKCDDGANSRKRKIEKQVYFHSTNKKKTTKKNKHLPNISDIHAEEIINSLQNDCNEENHPLNINTYTTI